MRIIGGTYKGRVLHPPKNLPVRPTTDFAKESLFNILNNHIDFDGLKVLDLFCGTGNITFEFFSRGSNDITSVDSNYQCCDFVKKTVNSLQMTNVKTIKSDVFVFLNKAFAKYDLVFADPPYAMEPEKFARIPQLVFEKQMLNTNGWLIVEHGQNINFTTHPFFTEHRKYGNVNFSFFRMQNIN
ncbi:MAG: RsmD family RNA methyltransferase [Bacteroidia bacterium]